MFECIRRDDRHNKKDKPYELLAYGGRWVGSRREYDQADDDLAIDMTTCYDVSVRPHNGTLEGKYTALGCP